MKTIIFFTLLAFASLGQNNLPDHKVMIHEFMNATMDRDTATISKYFADFATYQVIDYEGNKQIMFYNYNKSVFLNSYVLNQERKWINEENEMGTSLVEGVFGIVWTRYLQHYDNNKKMCGVRTYNVFLAENGWKIIQATETRFKSCDGYVKTFHLPR